MTGNRREPLPNLASIVDSLAEDRRDKESWNATVRAEIEAIMASPGFKDQFPPMHEPGDGQL